MFFPNPRNKPSTQTNIWQTPNLNPATKSFSKKNLATKSNLYQIQKNKKPIVHVKDNKSKPRIKLHLLTIKPRTRARIPSKLHVLTIKPKTGARISHNQTHHHHRLRASWTQPNKPILLSKILALWRNFYSLLPTIYLLSKFYHFWVWSKFEQIQWHHFCLLKSNETVSHH